MSAWPGNTLFHSQTVTAPGASAVLSQIVAPPEGVYKVIVTIILTGAAETALRNLALRENTTSVAFNMPTLSGVGPIVLEFDQVEVNAGGGNLDIIAIAAATAGAVYSTTLTATRIG